MVLSLFFAGNSQVSDHKFFQVVTDLWVSSFLPRSITMQWVGLSNASDEFSPFSRSCQEILHGWPQTVDHWNISVSSSYCSVKGQAEVLNKSILYLPNNLHWKMYQYKSQVLGKYKVPEIKLFLTLEIASHAGYDIVISKEFTGSIHPYAACWAGSLRGYSGFQLIHCALCGPCAIAVALGSE